MSCSIYQVNINSYDQIFPNKSLTTNNLLFTDSFIDIGGWNRAWYGDYDKNYPFDAVFKIRWNPFDYANTDYIIWIDGSIEIISDVSPLIDIMKNGSFDFAILNHPYRDGVFDEYKEWCNSRNYDKLKAYQWLNHFRNNGYNIFHENFYQTGIMIFKNTEICKSFCKDVYKELYRFNNEHVERLDQTVASYILTTKYQNMKTYIMDSSILNSELFKLHWSHPMN